MALGDNIGACQRPLFSFVANTSYLNDDFPGNIIIGYSRHIIIFVYSYLFIILSTSSNSRGELCPMKRLKTISFTCECIRKCSVIRLLWVNFCILNQQTCQLMEIYHITNVQADFGQFNQSYSELRSTGCMLPCKSFFFLCSRLQGSEMKQNCQVFSVHMQRHASLIA